MSQPDEQVDVRDTRHLCPPRNGAKEHAKLDVWLGPEDGEQLAHQRPMRANPGDLPIGEGDPARARPSCMDQATADRATKRALVDSDFMGQLFQ